MKVGDTVKIKNYHDPDNPKPYVILEIMDGWIRLKHPTIPGWFSASVDNVVEVISEGR